MITIEGPRLGIDLGTWSPQGKHTNHYTNYTIKWYYIKKEPFYILGQTKQLDDPVKKPPYNFLWHLNKN